MKAAAPLLANAQPVPGWLRPALEGVVRVVTAEESERTGLTAEVAANFQEALMAFPPHLRGGLVAGLGAFEVSTRAWPAARGRAFSALPPELAERAFRAWFHSPIFPVRQWAKGFKGLVALAYWDHPKIRAAVAFEPEAWIAKVKARRERDYAADIAAHAERVLAPNPLVRP